MAKILLVEDDPMIGEIYERKFSSAGFDVKRAVSGKQVLQFAGEEPFDLVLLDIILPGMNGLDVLKELKKSGNYDARMKVFIFSNLNAREEQDKAFENGADGFIPKTKYSPSELVMEVQRILQEYGEMAKNELRHANGNAEKGEENGRKKILLIEDEEIFMEMFGRKLEDEGYRVTFARNGAWGVKEALANDFDLIVMDMMMPAMSGMEMLMQLKKEEKVKNIPVIVLSASATDEEIQAVRDLGVVEYFIKTRVTPSDLARRVREVLKD
ncbi:MAG TPA: response regulator [Patescibacteria group bacterium]|nr:response regulator [Patescibacteria group bacterium]